MAIGDFDKLVQTSRPPSDPASANIEFRAQPNSKKASKRQLYTHKGMSMSEFLGIWKGRRAAKRRAGAEALKAMIDEQYHCRGLGEAVFREAQDYCREPAHDAKGRDFSAKVTMGDLVGLQQIAERLYREQSVKDTTAFLASPQFEKEVLMPLSQTGTQQHPYDANPRAWDLHIGLIREQIKKMRREGLENCNSTFKNLVTAIALGKGRTPVTSANSLEHLKAHLDKPQSWAQMVRNANLEKLADFAADDVNNYIANLQDCVDTWYQNKIADNAVGNITPDDIVWLKNEYGRLADSDGQPDPIDKNDYHADLDALGHSTDEMHRSFKADAQSFMISGGKFEEKRKRAMAMARSGRQLTDRDIADWHASYFRKAISERKDWRVRNADKRARQAEAILQSKFAHLPPIKSFVTDKADRGLHDGLRAGNLESVGAFMKTWIDANGLTGSLRNAKVNENALSHLEDSVFLLDEFADFQRDVDGLRAKHNNDLTNADSRTISDLQARARDIHGRLQDLEEYSQQLYQTDHQDLDKQTAVCDALDDAAEHIRSAITPYLNISEPLRARQNQAMLHQLPHIQALRNEQKGGLGFASHDDSPSQVASRAVLGAVANMTIDGGTVKALDELRRAGGVLDRYAGFVNEHGRKLVELESRSHSNKLTKNELQTLSKLRNEARTLGKDIEVFASKAIALRRALGAKAKRTEPAAALDAMDQTARLMLRRLRGTRTEDASDNSQDVSTGSIANLMRSAQRRIRRRANVVDRGFLHGSVRPPVSKNEFAKCGGMTLAIANAMKNPAFAERKNNMFRLATMSLPRFDDMLSRKMVSDPLARRHDPRLKDASRQVANGLYELRAVRDDLQVLRKQITDAKGTLPPVRFQGRSAPVPQEHRQSIYLKVIDQMEHEISQFETQMAGRLEDFQKYLAVGRS